jgi:hypothetical protein
MGSEWGRMRFVIHQTAYTERTKNNGAGARAGLLDFENSGIVP